MKLKHVVTDTDQRGNPRCYVRSKSGRKIRAPMFPDDEGFQEFWELARADKQPPRQSGTKYASDQDKAKLERLVKNCVWRAKYRSKSKGKGHDLSIEWAVAKLREQEYKCALTGLPLVPASQSDRRNPYAPSLDRIDCAKGYTEDNVRITCLAINVALSDFGADVFKRVSRAYLRNNSSRNGTTL